MSSRVLIPLPGVGTLALTLEAYEAALIPIAAPAASPAPSSATGESLVSAKVLSESLSLPISCIYEYAKAGRIPSVKVGKHVRFNQGQVLAALKKPVTASK